MIKDLRKQFFKAQKGFTLIELLLYMGIFSILLVVLMQLFTSILNVSLESKATSSVEQDGSYILSRLSYDIHNGTALTVSAVPPTAVTTCTWPTSTACQLQITGTPTNTYTVNNSGNLLINTTDQLNSDSTKVTQIVYTKLVNTASAVDNPNPKPSVRIAVTVQSKTIRRGGILQTKIFQTTIGVR